jgi:hypothetical protein
MYVYLIDLYGYNLSKLEFFVLMAGVNGSWNFGFYQNFKEKKGGLSAALFSWMAGQARP